MTRWTGAALVALFVVTVIAVAPALDGAFTFDEQAGVADNRAVHLGAPASAALTYRFSPDQTRPLFFLSLWIDARLHGVVPRGYRTTNLLLHLICGLVVFLLLRRAARLGRAEGARDGPADGAALAGTALFLLHPLQSESVIYIWGRSGVLAALLALLALLVSPWRSTLRLIAAWTLLALALAVKEEALVLPLMALVWWVVVERRPPGRAAADALLLAIPVALFVTLRLVVLGSAGRQVYVRSLADNLLGQGVVTLKMIGLTLWPVGLSIDHAVGMPSTATGLAAVAACLVLLGAVICGALRLPTPALRTACAGGVLYAAGMLLYWLVPLPDLMSERRAYLPLFGAALALTSLLSEAASRPRRQLAAIGSPKGVAAVALALLPTLVVAGLLAPALHARARLWAEPARLWAEAARLAPAAARPHINVGVITADHGDMATAAAEFDRAVGLEPHNPEALYNRGNLKLGRGDLAGARSDFEASVTSDPTVPRVRIGLAAALVRQERLVAAEEELRAALAIDPGDPRALTNLAEILRATGRAAEALPLYRQALDADPGYAHAAARLGVALEEAGDQAGALSAYREFLERRPLSDADTAAVRLRIEALTAALAAPGSIR